MAQPSKKEKTDWAPPVISTGIMTFRFVDQILAFEARRSIRGVKAVSRHEPYFYWLPDGRRALSPAVVSEAIAQLGGWLIMASTDFERRAVPIVDERTEYLDWVAAGDILEISSEIAEWTDDVVLIRGEASRRGEVIHKSHLCRAYLVDVKDFSDPAEERHHWRSLRREGLPGKGSSQGMAPVSAAFPAVCGPKTFDSLQFLDGILEHQPGKRVVALKNFTSTEPYFEHHFPRKPVVPGVLLLTFMGEACQYLIRNNLHAPVRQSALIPTHVEDVHFRKFVTPGDQAIIDVSVIQSDESRILVQAKMTVGDQRVLTGKMGFLAQSKMPL